MNAPSVKKVSNSHLYSQFTLVGVIFLIMWAVGHSAYISNYPATATTTSTLSSAEWNKMTAGLQTLDNNLSNLSFSGGNVGIGNTPTAKLDVNGTIKATNLQTTGAFVSTLLNQCSGGPCGWDHGINTWINVGSYNYAWTTPTNTDPSTFTSNNHGVITVNKAGLYVVQENVMMMPTTDRAWISYGCPFINGAANCWDNAPSDTVPHSYSPAGNWKTERMSLYFQLNAGDTVSYGYQIYGNMTYWGHNGYTAMRITRIN